ncbi:hypothetical protein [Methylocaldum szegediense]|jgi:hypothetical protein|uniref:Uncharacterized protein n=1 Tax=Methylocaldum szegediense TaxID=73780 RepID=A0ABM9I486_9GAMM|nr:hypothetical protein [Methylocaldum szegediense]CAI8881820.1 protein of unknown function [Methylocaldum szegediense]
MHDPLAWLKRADFPRVIHNRLDTLQVDLGYRCNQQSFYCPVGTGLKRTEMKGPKTATRLTKSVRASGAIRSDFTDGTREVNPNFRSSRLDSVLISEFGLQSTRYRFAVVADRTRKIYKRENENCYGIVLNRLYTLGDCRDGVSAAHT